MSTLLSTSLRRAGRDGAAFAEHLESHAADGTFDMLDTSATGTLTAEELEDCHARMYSTLLTTKQVADAIQFVCGTALCDKEHFTECLREIHHRHVLLESLKWDFMMLSSSRSLGALSIRSAEFLMRASITEFPETAWKKFISSRKSGSQDAISLEELSDWRLKCLSADTLEDFLEEEEEEAEPNPTTPKRATASSDSAQHRQEERARRKADFQEERRRRAAQHREGISEAADLVPQRNLRSKTPEQIREAENLMKQHDRQRAREKQEQSSALQRKLADRKSSRDDAELLASLDAAVSQRDLDSLTAAISRIKSQSPALMKHPAFRSAVGLLRELIAEAS